jgi:hypothetical protein
MWASDRLRLAGARGAGCLDGRAAKLTRVTVASKADMLALQIVALSRLNWRKHRQLQLSVALTVLSMLTMSVVAVAPYLGWRG